jgi:hypothetical protein
MDETVVRESLSQEIVGRPIWYIDRVLGTEPSPAVAPGRSQVAIVARNPNVIWDANRST